MRKQEFYKSWELGLDGLRIGPLGMKPKKKWVGSIENNFSSQVTNIFLGQIESGRVNFATFSFYDI